MSYFTINRVVLVGRLTRDPELRSLPSGTVVCALRIACNSARRDGDGGFEEKPNFFDVSVYGPAGESTGRYLHKGSRVGVDGRLDWREWETTDQQRRQAVSVVADSVQFLDAAGERSSASPPDGEQPGGYAGTGEGPDGEELVGVGAEEGDLAF